MTAVIVPLAILFVSDGTFTVFYFLDFPYLLLSYFKCPTSLSEKRTKAFHHCLCVETTIETLVYT